MAPTTSLVAALLATSHADLDEHSMLQVIFTDQQLEGKDSDECRCPGYYQERCEAEAHQGCVWSDQGSSNKPWCQCLGTPFEPPPTPAPVPPPVTPGLTFSEAGTDNWCSQINRDQYEESSSSRIHWALDNNNGWRWCQISPAECQEECTALGGCEEIYYTPNQCCFPSRSACHTGGMAPGGSGGQRYIAFDASAVVPFTEQGSDNYCELHNVNQYQASSSSHPDWTLGEHGWRWCGITAEVCQRECNVLGGCQEIYWTPNNCCFPSRTTCNGDTHPGGPGGRKFIATLPAPVAPVELFFTEQGSDNWCSLSNNDQYQASSSTHTGWALDTNAGWRWCGMSALDCQRECTDLGGCQEIYWTPNNCCFPSRSTCDGDAAPGGSGGRKFIAQ